MGSFCGQESSGGRNSSREIVEEISQIAANEVANGQTRNEEGLNFETENELVNTNKNISEMMATPNS